MAHFAEVDAKNVVTRVVVMPDDATPDSCADLLGVRCGACQGCLADRAIRDRDPRGEPDPADSKTDCTAPTQWVQTSYSGSIRTRYAGVGFEWHEDLDAFVVPPTGDKNNFTLDPNTKAYMPLEN